MQCFDDFFLYIHILVLVETPPNMATFAGSDISPHVPYDKSCKFVDALFVRCDKSQNR